MGKGSKRRPGKGYAQGWERIWETTNGKSEVDNRGSDQHKKNRPEAESDWEVHEGTYEDLS